MTKSHLRATQAAPLLPIDDVLETAPVPAGSGISLGTSRQGRDVAGYRIGSGPRSVSLIAGCHADEPVGPAMLDRLAAYLLELPASAPLLSGFTWHLVPHVNPDGEARNAGWTESVFGDGADPLAGETGVDLGRYLTHAVREPPGDDVEFGFPRDAGDDGARPENRRVAEFLQPGAPFALHASFHGMSFAAGPWFLIEAAWAERTAAMRERLRHRVHELGYRLHDVDRGGEKGFHRIDEGFTTRPDSRPMAAHFEALGDPATAALFRPSSMEHVRSLGGDPLTLVSEMPLFLVPPEHYRPVGAPSAHHGSACAPSAHHGSACAPSAHHGSACAPSARPGGNVVVPAVVRELAAEPRPEKIRCLAAARGIEPMPIVDQMRLQLEFLQAGLDACCPKQ